MIFFRVVCQCHRPLAPTSTSTSTGRASVCAQAPPAGSPPRGWDRRTVGQLSSSLDLALRRLLRPSRHCARTQPCRDARNAHHAIRSSARALYGRICTAQKAAHQASGGHAGTNRSTREFPLRSHQRGRPVRCIHNCRLTCNIVVHLFKQVITALLRSLHKFQPALPSSSSI